MKPTVQQVRRECRWWWGMRRMAARNALKVAESLRAQGRNADAKKEERYSVWLWETARLEVAARLHGPALTDKSRSKQFGAAPGSATGAALAHEEWWRVERYDPDQKGWFEIQRNYDSRDAAEAGGTRMERRDGDRWNNWRVRHYDTRTYDPKPRHSPSDDGTLRPPKGDVQ